MNKDIQYLTKLLYLNEDLLSDLENEEDDDSDFIFNTDKNVVCIFTIKDKPSGLYMHSYNSIGDILTYNKRCKLFYIIKNNFNLDTLKNDTYNTEKYGDLIGICVGKGLWASTKILQNNHKIYKWCRFDKDTIAAYYSSAENFIGTLYNNNFETSLADGYYNTIQIISQFKNDIKDTIWEKLSKMSVPGLGKNIAYLPSIEELNKIAINAESLKIPNHWQMSSSQVDGNKIYVRGFSSSKIEKFNKCNLLDAIVLLHFD